MPDRRPEHLGRLDLLVTKLVSRDKARLEALFASIGEGVLATDEHGIITRVNKAALDILGYQPGDLIGRRLPVTLVAVHDDGTPLEMSERPIAKVFLHGRTISERTRYLRKDGTPVSVQVTLSPIMYQGRPVGVIDVFRDLTLEIQNEKLKSDFISVASHQLRTPLSAINIYTRMLNDGMAGEVTPGQRKYIKIILGSIDRMNELISTLLDVTRIEAGQIAVHIESVNLRTLLQSLLVELQPALKDKNLVLETHLDKQLPRIQTDGVLVKEVFSNLLSNAIRYTPDGGRIEVVLAALPNDLVFTVRDSGYGIPLADQKLIFTKFFRAANAIVEQPGGTGLGLYLTKTVADTLEGDVWFESVQNEGSTFYFSLPRRGSMAKPGKFRLGT